MRYLLKVLYISHPVFKDDRHDQKSTAARDFKCEIKMHFAQHVATKVKHQYNVQSTALVNTTLCTIPANFWSWLSTYRPTPQ